MKRNTRIIASLVAIALLCSVLVPLTVEAEAGVPEWDKGDTWAMHYDESISTMFAPGLDMIDVEMLEDIMDEEGELEDLDMDISGNLEVSLVMEVTEVGDENYVVDIDINAEASANIDLEITGQMPKEGTTDPDDTESRTITAIGSVSFSMEVAGELVFRRSDLALVSAKYDMDMSVIGSIEVNNFMDIEKAMEEEIFEYTDYEFGIEITMEANVDVSYDPPLDMFNFPMEEGKWTASSTVTTTGQSITTTDITGIPDSLKEMMDMEEMPIIEEETIDEVEEIEMDIESTSGTMVLDDGEIVDVYVLTAIEDDSYDDEPEFKMFYSPKHGNIISATLSFADTPMAEYMTEDQIQLMPVDPSELEDDDNGIPFISTQLMLLSILGAVVITTLWKKNKEGY